MKNSASANLRTCENICNIFYAHFGHVRVVYWSCVLMQMGSILEQLWDLLCFCAAQFLLMYHWMMLKPMYSFGKWWKWKMSLWVLFIFRVTCMSSKSPVNLFCLKPSIFWENCIKLTFSGCPRKFYHRVMYISPSSGHISLIFNMPFKLILRRFEVVFWCLEWEYCIVWKIDGNSLKSTNTILWL